MDDIGRAFIRRISDLGWFRARSQNQPEIPRPTTSTDVLAVHHGDDLFEIRLAGPARRNALGRETIDRIESLASVPPVGTRVILVTAEGVDFCAGYDLIEASRTGPEGLIAHNSNFSFLKRAGVPVIAALHGNVIGGGLELALAADIRLATPDTKFALPANRLGLIYSEEGVRLLVNELGESVTRAMLLAGKTFGAEEARAMGVVADVVPSADLDERALELARTITSWPSLATSGNRRLVDAVVGRTAEDLDALHRTSFVEGGELMLSIERFVHRRDAADAPGNEPVNLVVRRVRTDMRARLALGTSSLRRAVQHVATSRTLQRRFRATKG